MKKYRQPIRTGLMGLLFLAVPSQAALAENGGYVRDGRDRGRFFERIATFEVIGNSLQNEAGAARTDERVAEIIDASADGKTLIYADSPGAQIGLVDIADPEQPQGLATLKVGGEPTSVAVVGRYALVGVNTSPDFVSPSGELAVIDISIPAAPREVHRFTLGGQPDSVAVSPDRRYAAIVIENERDEDLEDPGLTPEEGGLPQSPAGALQVLRLRGAPTSWRLSTVDLTGLADFAPEDPEPEFVDINRRNIAAVSLQENNHIVLVDLRRGKIVKDFSAGTVTLRNVDDEDNGLIELTKTLEDLPREPDALAWAGDGTIATANEGDLVGGSRGFTLFGPRGKVRFDIGSDFEHLAVRHGHYQEGRSDNKGSEPEGIEYGRFGRSDLLFVGAERAGFVAVYRLGGHGRPKLHQILPTGIGPEGLKAIPKRDLFVVASEVDAPAEAETESSGFRSVISIYRLQRRAPSYPTIVSANRPGEGASGHPRWDRYWESKGLPIPWAALGALAADRHNEDILYTAHDSFFGQSRIYVVDVRRRPAVIFDEILLRNEAGETVDLDIEGLTQSRDGGFWVVSEGVGSVDDDSRPVTAPNLLLKVAPDGAIRQTIELPAAVKALQRRFGFEGVAVADRGQDEKVLVAFQREWVDDPAGYVRIGVYDPAEKDWGFFYYPLEVPPFYDNAWVGLSEIVHLGRERFAVIERDNLIGEAAEIKKLYTFSIEGLNPAPQGEDFPILEKTEARDLLPDLQAPNGSVLDKPEGLAVGPEGDTYLVTDNDGVDDSPGETQFLRLGAARRIFGR